MRFFALCLAMAAPAVLLWQGCGGIEHIPVNPFLALEDSNERNFGDNTSQAVSLPQDVLQPPLLRIGEFLTVQGQGRIFPAGFARFTFAGNSITEVFLPRPTGQVRVRVPPGTISGPLGFQISGKSINFDSGIAQTANADEVQAYRIPHPGLRILGAAEPPGGDPNSPFPQGPPVVPVPAPSFAGTL